METNNNTWMTHGKHGNDRGDWPLSIVVFEDDPYHFRLLQHHLTAMNPNHEIMGPLTTTEAGKADMRRFFQRPEVLSSDTGGLFR